MELGTVLRFSAMRETDVLVTVCALCTIVQETYACARLPYLYKKKEG